MSALKAHELKADPIFDMMYYMELSGATRMEHELLQRAEAAWQRWGQHLRVYKLSEGGPEDSGYLLIFLDEPVEREVEEIWQQNPAQGMEMHNLAICYVMSAGSAIMPELAMGCAPLPTPTGDVKRAFKRLGVEWKDDGTITRQYAMFTNHPYRASGGCASCHSRDTCQTAVVFGQDDEHAG